MMDIGFKLKNFTPVIDEIMLEKGSNGKPLGAMGALAYGAVYRHCQMGEGVCFASLSTLAEKSGMTRRNLIKWIKELCHLGYIEDLTPDQKGKPHTYRITGKAIIKGELSASTSESESPVEKSRAGQLVNQNHQTSESESLALVNQNHPRKQYRKQKGNNNTVVVDKKLSDRLERLGILKTVHAELANLSHVTTGYLDEWIGYHARQPRPPGGGFYVQQIRYGDIPPLVESSHRSPQYDPETLAALRATQAKINQEKRELSHV